MAETMILKVNTGAVNISLQDKDGEEIGTFKFNPADTSIIGRLEQVIDFFNSVSFGDEINEEDTLDKVKELDRKIGEQFDFLFGYKVADGIFGKCGACTFTENGDMYFEVVLEQIATLIERTMQKRVEKKVKKIKKYTDKYLK